MGGWYSTAVNTCHCDEESCCHEGPCGNASGWDAKNAIQTQCAPCVEAKIIKSTEQLQHIKKGVPSATGIEVRCPCKNTHDRCGHSEQCWTATSMGKFNNPQYCAPCYIAGGPQFGSGTNSADE